MTSFRGVRLFDVSWVSQRSLFAWRPHWSSAHVIWPWKVQKVCQPSARNVRWLRCCLRACTDVKSADSSFSILTKLLPHSAREPGQLLWPNSQYLLRVFVLPDWPLMTGPSHHPARCPPWQSTLLRSRTIRYHVIVADSLEVHRCSRLTKGTPL